MTNFSEKAQEIGYVLVRVASYVRRKDFRARLEGLAFALIEQAAKDEVEDIIKTIAAVAELAKLGASIYEIETVNAGIIISELNALQSEIRRTYGLDALPDLKSLFTPPQRLNRTTETPMPSLSQVVTGFTDLGNFENHSAIADSHSATELPSENGELPSENAESLRDAAVSAMTNVGAAMRQSAILSKIRSLSGVDASGNPIGCRMKDLMAVFPDVSERTLRNDIVRLLSQGFIERVGVAGPSSFYVIK